MLNVTIIVNELNSNIFKNLAVIPLLGEAI